MTQVVIRLNAQTSLDDVVAWPDSAGQILTFQLSRTSSFEAGTEGVALGYLAAAVKRGASIKLLCEFPLPNNLGEFNGLLFASTFGYALIRICEEAKFSSTPQNCADKLRSFAGKLYDEQKGAIGLGDRVSLIAFDPKRPIPRALLARSESIDHHGLPLPSAFQADIVRILSGMGLPEIGSQSTLPIIISFIYELFENTLEHGRPVDNAVLKFSTRGISFTKIAYSTQQLATRKMSPGLKEFLFRIAEMEKRETNLLVVCISVMDMGQGIQNTLPEGFGEDSYSRLLRAFTENQTRKLYSSVNRGLGLLKVVQAAHRLGARLQVTSAGQIAIKDFSLGEDKLPTIQGAVGQAMPPYFSCGTSVDMYVPSLLNNVDQQKLVL